MSYSAERIGRRLDSGLTDRGITPAEIAERLGVSREIVANWVSGRTPIPLLTACEICDLLDWPLDKLAVRNEAA